MFSAEPWEVEEAPHDSKLNSIQLVSWNGKEWEVALEQLPGHNRWLRFRLVDGPLLADDRNFKPHGTQGQTAKELIKHRFIECLDQEQWERTLYLDLRFQLRAKEEPKCYSLSVSPDGSGYFLGQRIWSVPFRWTAVDLTQIKAHDLMAYLEGEHDFRFARAYIGMSDDERWNQTWRWKHGDQHELEQVLTWAFLAQEELWQQETDLWLRLSLPRNQNNSGVCLYSGPHPIQGKEAPQPLTPALHGAILKTVTHFAPSLKRAHIEQHEVLLQLLRTDHWRININPGNPTAHERIEAALKWREWLAKHELSA